MAVAGLIIDQNATAETNLENFMPQDSQALEDIRTLRSTIGSTEQIAVVLKGDNLFDIESLTDIKKINMLLTQSFSDVVIESQSLIHLFASTGITDINLISEAALKNIPVDQRKLFINESNTTTVINVSIAPMSDNAFETFISDLETDLIALDSSLLISITGQSIIDNEMMKALTAGRYEITLIGLALIFISLLVIYRSFYRALLPLIPIVLIVGWSGLIMGLFQMSYTPLTATLGALIMGIGTEFTILISERFEEELLKTDDRNEAIKTALSKMANPILVSAQPQWVVLVH